MHYLKGVCWNPQSPLNLICLEMNEPAFLKERYNLAQGGVDRKSVKLRNGHIYVDNTLYGKL